LTRGSLPVLGREKRRAGRGPAGWFAPRRLGRVVVTQRRLPGWA